jgi:spermidine synthase
VGDAFTDIAVPAHLVTREFFALVRDRLAPDGVFVMNVIDFEDRLHALASLTATLESVFPVVEIWTRAEQPTPGSRMVFVLVAADTPSLEASVLTPAPALSRFGALSEDFMQGLRARNSVILTDDYAPIDRLVGTGATITDVLR